MLRGGRGTGRAADGHRIYLGAYENVLKLDCNSCPSLLWAARRGPQAPPGDVRARLRGRTGPQGTTEGPELARGESRGTPGDTEAGGSGEFKWSLWGMRRVPKTHESPLLDARGPSQGGASGCPFGGDFREPLRMDGRRKQDLKG